MDDKGQHAVTDAFRMQVAYCEANSAPITARIVGAIGAVLAGDASNALLERVRRWQGAPLADAVPLRVAGGLHALHLAGGEPALDAMYRGMGGNDADIVADVILRREAELLPWLDGPPQTNEAGRSSNFIAAMLWLAQQGLAARFECFEIGSSAGINLMMDRYAYDLGGVKVGPQSPAMAFRPEWRGAPPPEREIEIVSLEGCDVAPVNLADPAQAQRLKAYIWPEHTIRFDRMDAAIRAACDKAPDLVGMNAADFAESRLSQPQETGVTRVLMHSIVWQYVPQDQQQRVTRAMEDAAARATPERPLAWVCVEANRETHVHELTVRHWPQGPEPRMLAVAHAHGAYLEWLPD
ncbi:DUF2332 family protein [Altererythrobacter confluentis]|uniref:DUF2332 family protein n=1 Tax=Allopontixanthobacter confluentis TaxID=1849021 RepID=A0A6L7GE03_9SPHN|nr:DUF2332 domain-containing protein [Allopontixanthobacter confluentis]MXP13686.1 DUF2332 family protein [Allopontixanthobacter confluentis]